MDIKGAQLYSRKKGYIVWGRYFVELNGLIDFLCSTIIYGQVDNATIILQIHINLYIILYHCGYLFAYIIKVKQ